MAEPVGSWLWGEAPTVVNDKPWRVFIARKVIEDHTGKVMGPDALDAWAAANLQRFAPTIDRLVATASADQTFIKILPGDVS